MVPGPWRLTHWELCNFSMDMGSCYMDKPILDKIVFTMWNQVYWNNSIVTIPQILMECGEIFVLHNITCLTSEIHINDLINLELSIHPSAKIKTLSGEWTRIDWLGNICPLICTVSSMWDAHDMDTWDRLYWWLLLAKHKTMGGCVWFEIHRH